MMDCPMFSASQRLPGYRGSTWGRCVGGTKKAHFFRALDLLAGSGGGRCWLCWQKTMPGARRRLPSALALARGNLERQRLLPLEDAAGVRGRNALAYGRRGTRPAADACTGEATRVSRKARRGAEQAAGAPGRGGVGGPGRFWQGNRAGRELSGPGGSPGVEAR